MLQQTSWLLHTPIKVDPLPNACPPRVQIAGQPEFINNEHQTEWNPTTVLPFKASHFEFLMRSPSHIWIKQKSIKLNQYCKKEFD